MPNSLLDSGDRTPTGEPRDPRFQELEDYALGRAMESKKAEVRQKWLDITKTIRDAEKVKQEAEEQGREAAYAKSRFWATTLTPALSVAIAFIAICVQSVQISYTAKTHAEESEDAKWRELLKSVKFESPKSAVVGALAVEGFFGSHRYGAESRSIATALLPLVNNVNAFDEIVDAMESKTNQDNQKDLSNVSAMLLYLGREQHKLKGAINLSSPAISTFLQHDIDSIDPNPTYTSCSGPMCETVIAWELDTVSQNILRAWRHTKAIVSPVDQDLENVVLENGDFRDLDFTKSDFKHAILYDASFKNAIFKQANLKGVSILNVCLSGADLSQITPGHFEESVWEGSNWWDAKPISPDLRKYLDVHYPQPNPKPAEYGACEKWRH